MPRLLALLASTLIALTGLRAEESAWIDTRGNQFKAEPAETLGGIAVFKQGKGASKLLRLGELPPAECIRFYQAIANHPERAMNFTEAQGLVSRELMGRVSVIKGKELVPADLTKRPEPSIYVVLYGSEKEGNSYKMISNFMTNYKRLKAAYPDFFEGLFFGVRHSSEDHLRLARHVGGSMLIANAEEEDRMKYLLRYVPAEQSNVIVALSREGVPLLSTPAENVQEIKKFLDRLSTLLMGANPAGFSSARDRYHYAMHTRPLQFAASSAPPLLIYDSVQNSSLRKQGLTNLRASIEVDPEGRATAVQIDPAITLAPEARSKLEQAMQRNLRFCPAIDQGTAATGTFFYEKTCAAKDPLSPAERTWIENPGMREIPLPTWLVLRPIPVSEDDVKSTAKLSSDGVYQLSKMEVASKGVTKTAQKSAFNSNWFDDEGGPITVRPVEGEKQMIGEEKYTWTKLKSEDGYVELLGALSRDYCIGYATTVIDCEKDTDALLGLGSDDGVKIWCNGELVKDAWVSRASQLDQDIVPMKLKAGSNRILIKIQNIRDHWNFICRLRVVSQ